MQSSRIPRTQAVRGPRQRFSGRDIDASDAWDGLARSLRAAIPYVVAIVAIVAAVWIVEPRVLAATAGMP